MYSVISIILGIVTTIFTGCCLSGYYDSFVEQKKWFGKYGKYLLIIAFVVTDSFHACVFSILFNKPFIVFGNYERGIGRFISLFEFFNINNVLISKQHYNIRPELDYIEINKKHVLYKNNSLMLLMNCLKEQLYD